MFIKAITVDGSTALSATSSITFSETDIINLTNKIYDGKKLALSINITSAGNTAISTDSGQLFIYPLVASTRGGSYSTFVTGSATSLVLAGGTTVSNIQGKGEFYIPLTIVEGIGVTARLDAVPYIKFGYRAWQGTKPWTGTLCIG